MSKKSKKDKKTKLLSGQKGSSSLISRKAIETVPLILGSESVKKRVKEKIRSFTQNDAAPSPLGIQLTPGGQHLVVDANGKCGNTPQGSELIWSPTRSLAVDVFTPAGRNKKSVSIHLLERQKNYKARKSTMLYRVLEAQQKNPRAPIAAKATKKTRDSQPKRCTQPKEKSVVKKSAAELVIEYFKKKGVKISDAEIKALNWNLCHLLSYGIAKNALTSDDTVFDTQISENLFSGSRALNENMMKIENPLLQMINENAAKEIEYIGLHSEYEDSHILASLTLRVNMLTHDNRFIRFSREFDVTDTRKQEKGDATAYYIFLKTISEGSFSSVNSQSFFSLNAKKEDNSVVRELNFGSPKKLD